MAYDEKADRTIFFDDNIYGDAKTLATKTWAYDCSSNTWTNLNAQGAPDGLNGARMVYDSKDDRMILFGGIVMPMPDDWMSGDWTQSNETWAYDYQTNTWTNMHPKVSAPGENFFGMDYDSDSGLVLAWIQPNGINGPTGDNMLWTYDFAKNTWTSIPITQPAYRIYNIAAYVPTMKKTFYFGGATMDNETPNNDLWTYDSATNTWAQISTSTGPSPRAWATLTYSSKADKLVLIGGGADRDHFTAEVWIYDPQAKTWTQVGPQ
jgi:N-acetylneuraminic acid mutarotase